MIQGEPEFERGALFPAFAVDGGKFRVSGFAVVFAMAAPMVETKGRGKQGGVAECDPLGALFYVYPGAGCAYAGEGRLAGVAWRTAADVSFAEGNCALEVLANLVGDTVSPNGSRRPSISRWRAGTEPVSSLRGSIAAKLELFQAGTSFLAGAIGDRKAVV